MIKSIHPDQIVPWELNPRKRIDAKSLQPLVDSMRSVGWFGAIMVRPAGEPDLYQVLAGERRWRAAKTVGLEGIAAEVREMSDKDAIELAVIENRDREDLDIIEEAGGYRAMVDLGWSVKEIASRSGKSEQSIYQRLDIWELAEDVKDALRDKTISLVTGLALGRITDDDDRSEALERIVKPRVQDHPLTERPALALIQRDYLDPQKRQVAWEKKCKSLRKEFGKDVEIKSVQDAGEVTSWTSGYVRCDVRPLDHELAVHARELDEEMIPTWGDLADKHGARKVVVPDQAGDPVFYVEKDPLITAEIVLGEKDPKGCIFPIAGGAGRHEQSVEAEREWEETQAKRNQEVEQNLEAQRALVKEIHDGMFGLPLGKRWKAADLDEKMRALVPWALRKHDTDGMCAVADLLQIDLEALGEGDHDAGLESWLEGIGMNGARGAVFALVGLAISNLWPGSDECRETLDEVRGILSEK